MTGRLLRPGVTPSRGMTLIELIIVMTIVGILIATAAPGYHNYILRVHRNEAIRILLQASMCQERISANSGLYDTSLCHPGSEQGRYDLTYTPSQTRGRNYVVTATPKGAQLDDPCGKLSLDQNGVRSISANNISTVKCWNGQ